MTHFQAFSSGYSSSVTQHHTFCPSVQEHGLLASKQQQQQQKIDSIAQQHAALHMSK
jgi:hypothetical protein